MLLPTRRYLTPVHKLVLLSLSLSFLRQFLLLASGAIVEIFDQFNGNAAQQYRVLEKLLKNEHQGVPEMAMSRSVCLPLLLLLIIIIVILLFLHFVPSPSL